MTNTPTYEIINPIFESFVQTNESPQTIATGYTWTEGPVWMNDALYFNDIPNKKMLCWTPQDGVKVAIDDTDFANGNTVDCNGNMISCEHGGRRVIRRLSNDNMDNIQIIADAYDGKRLNSPNDAVVKSDGSVWFTDPPYGINSDVEGYPADSEIGGCFVYCLTPDNQLSAVATDFDKPNGLAFSPDEKTLYIADSGAILGASFPGMDMTRPHHIRVFDVDGHRLTNSRVFAEITPGVPDGLRIDHEGYIWTSAMDGIQCFTPDGDMIGKILLPSQTSNCCFGGASGTNLFITASESVYMVKTNRWDARHKTNPHV